MDLKLYFGKKSKKREEPIRQSLIVASSSDEEPLPNRKMRKSKRKAKIAKILSDEESPENVPSKKKPTEKLNSKLYQKISKVSAPTQPEVDPASFFSSQLVESDEIRKKRKFKKENVINNSESILSDENESSQKRFKSSINEPSPSKSHDKRANFLKALQREPSRLLGSRPLPIGSKNCLESLTFVISGILECFDRDDTNSLVQRYGGRVTSAVSRKTSYLVVGREPGETKINKAKELGTPILDEEGFYKLITDSYEPDREEEIIKHEEVFVEKSHPKSVGSELWVDKYKPKSINEIVGQNGPKSSGHKLVNWLKNWSKNRKIKDKKTKEDGSIFKAALLSGHPGIGKTTTALLACKELGLDFVELNASDTRSKKCLDHILSACLQNFRISAQPARKSVLIMDEVDGMSGNEDRGGVQELIHLIKTSLVPIICICNDRMHSKIRSLANHCFDLRFYKPHVASLKTYIQKIAESEGLKIDPQAAEQIVQISQSDVRSILNNLQMWSVSTNYLSFDSARSEAKSCEKDSKENVFEIARKIFTRSSTLKMSINDKLELFFMDYSLIPLFVQENYLLSAVPETGIALLNNLSNAAESLSLSVLCENLIRKTNEWSLLPTQGIFSCVITPSLMSGGIIGPIKFPQFLGKLSNQNKNKNILKEIVFHTQLKFVIFDRSFRTTKSALILDYLPYLNTFLYTPLIEEETEGVEDVIERMISFDLTRDDWDSIVELYQWSSLKLQPVPTKVKTSFTRSYNKIDHKYSFAYPIAGSKTKLKDLNSEDEFNDDENSQEEKEKEDDKMIKVISTPALKIKKARVPRKAKT